MANRKTFSATEKGFSEALREVERLQSRLIQKNQLFVELMTFRAQMAVLDNIEYYDKINGKSTGELYQSVISNYDPSSNTGTVEVMSDHALFVEYGTGVVGQDSPHPSPPFWWVYNTREAEGLSPNWWWFDDRSGRWYETMGEPASPFFYDSVKQMEKEMLDFAKEVFRT